MRNLLPLTFAACLCAAFNPAQAAEFDDPTWPCVQRKVETLSLGLMWPNPVEALAEDAPEALQRDITELAEALALRRVALEDLGPRVSAFSEKYDGDPAHLGQVFERVFNALSKRRGRIITGIGEFSLSQIALADKIDAARLEMDSEMEKSEPDFDRVDTLEEQIDWDQVIYSDRQRSIQYLCETPTILERRLFGISQMLQQAVRDS